MAKRLKWGTLEELDRLIKEYFADENEVACVAGICLKLDINRDTWNYYTTNKWATKRATEEETEAIEKDFEEQKHEDIFEDVLYSKDNMEVIGNNCVFTQSRAENYTIKRLVSDIFKKAQLQIEYFYNKQLVYRDKPVGAIFYLKAQAGYRETDSNDNNNNGSMPSKITIQIMPAPNQPQIDTSKISIKTE